jgi:hypothetical protein
VATLPTISEYYTAFRDDLNFNAVQLEKLYALLFCFIHNELRLVVESSVDIISHSMTHNHRLLVSLPLLSILLLV